MRAPILIILVALLYSCKTQKVYVPVESTRIEYKDRLQRDSIYLRDSIYVAMRNDTFYFEKYRTLYRDRIIRDSIFKTDTIKQPYPVVETEYVNRLNLWQRIMQSIGYITIGILIGCGIFKLKKIIG